MMAAMTLEDEEPGDDETTVTQAIPVTDDPPEDYNTQGEFDDDE